MKGHGRGRGAEPLDRPVFGEHAAKQLGVVAQPSQLDHAALHVSGGELPGKFRTPSSSTTLIDRGGATRCYPGERMFGLSPMVPQLATAET